MRFDKVDLGSPTVQQRIAAYRRSLAEQLQQLLEDEKLPNTITVAELIERLKGQP